MEISIQGVAATPSLGQDAGYKAIAEAGFTAVDWTLDSCWDRNKIKAGVEPERCIYDEPLEKLIEYFEPELLKIREAGLKVTQAHAPFPPSIDGNPGFTERCVRIFKKIIKVCERAECKNVVIHGIRHYPGCPESEQKIRERNLDMYGALIPTLKGSNVRVLLENLPVTQKGVCFSSVCSDPHEAVDYIDTLNDMAGGEYFGLCFDTGHLNIVRVPMHGYITTLGRRIKALHIHDNSADGDRHLVPYAGTIFWDEFCDALREIGYDGDLSFESFMQTSPRRMPRELVPSWLKLTYDCGDYFRSRITGKSEK